MPSSMAVYTSHKTQGRLRLSRRTRSNSLFVINGDRTEADLIYGEITWPNLNYEDSARQSYFGGSAILKSFAEWCQKNVSLGAEI